MPDPTKKRASLRERLALAHRVRAGTIGILSCCTCDYPLTQHDTATRHAEECPAHGMTLSAMEASNHWSLGWTKSGTP